MRGKRFPQADRATARLEPWQLLWIEQHRLACRLDLGASGKRAATVGLSGSSDLKRRCYLSRRRRFGQERALQMMGFT